MTQELELSFVDTKHMNTDCKSAKEFDAIVAKAELHPIALRDGYSRKVLQNYDFSEVDFTQVKKRDFTGWVIKNVIFSKPSIEKKTKTIMSGFSFVGAKLERVTFAQAQLDRCNFDTPDMDAISLYLDRIDQDKSPELRGYYGNCMKIPKDKQEQYIQTTLKEVDFFFSDLRHCRFRKARMTAVDFRYTVIKDCTLRESEIELGDFYSCNFKGTTAFQKSDFINCSITNAVFEDQCLRMNNIRHGILQSHMKKYDEMVLNYPKWYRYNPCMNFSSMLHKADAVKISSEAKEVYKQLSGIYAGKGLNSDSNTAYKKFVNNDLKHNWVSIGANWHEKQYWDCCKNIGRIISDIGIILCGYGYMFWAIVAWFILLVVYFASLCYDDKHDEVESLSYSLSNSLGPFDEYYNIVQGILPSIESVIGVLLVGFLGFVMANKIRNNS